MKNATKKKRAGLVHASLKTSRPSGKLVGMKRLDISIASLRALFSVGGHRPYAIARDGIPDDGVVVSVAVHPGKNLISLIVVSKEFDLVPIETKVDDLPIMKPVVLTTASEPSKKIITLSDPNQDIITPSNNTNGGG